MKDGVYVYAEDADLGLAYFFIDAPFTIDGIEYDWRDASNHRRPIIDVIEEDPDHLHKAWSCTHADPPTEAELDSFVKTGQPFGVPY